MTWTVTKLACASIGIAAALGGGSVLTHPSAATAHSFQQPVADSPLNILVTSTDRRKTENGGDLLLLEGRIVNPTDRPLPVPAIEAEALSIDGIVLHRWVIAPPVPILAGKASVTFHNAELDIPAETGQLRLTLGSMDGKPVTQDLT